MLNNLKQRKKQEGFTIIEVLIVLAIAGLILLIVFLAVPALQRNARNTTRRSEAGRIGAAANDFIANSNGTLPVAADAATITTSVGTLQQYSGGVSVMTQTALGTTVPTSSQAIIVTQAACSGNSVGVGSARQMVVFYGLEPSGTKACNNI